MDVRVPRALWDDVVNFDAQVWDGAATCTQSGFGLVQGAAQQETHQMFDKTAGQASFNLTAGIPHVFYVVGFNSSGTVIAAGCKRASVDAGATLTIMITMGPPDTMSGGADNCASAGEFDANGRVDNQSIDALHDDDFGTCGGQGGKDAVYHFHNASPQRVILSSTASFAHHIYVRSKCGDRTSELAMSCQMSDADNNSVLDLQNLAAGDYFVWIDSVDASATGTYSLHLQQLTPGNPPSNDTCFAPTALQVGVPTNGTLVGAIDNATGSCGGANNADVVYKLDVPQASRLKVTVNATGSGSTFFDPVVYVRHTCSATSEFPAGACAETTANPEVLDLPSVDPGTYFIWVDSGDGNAGPFTIQADLLTVETPPSNDSCAMPQLLTDGAPVTGDTTAAFDNATGTCHRGTGADLVYSFTIGQPRRVHLDLTNTTADFYMYVRSSPCDTGTELRCHDSVKDTAGDESIDMLNVPAGTYYVFVDGQNGATGTFTLTYSTDAPTPAPGDDNCSAPTVLQSGVPLANQTLGGAQDDSVGSCAPAPGRGADVVYQFTITQTQDIFLHVDSDADVVVYVRSSPCDQSITPDGGTANEKACVNAVAGAGTESIVLRALPPGTYFVWVDGANEDIHAGFTITYTARDPAPPGDTCDQATPLTAGAPVQDTLQGAHDEYGGSCGGSGNGDVEKVFYFTLSVPQHVTLTSSALFDHFLYMRGPGTSQQDVATCTDTTAQKGCTPSITQSAQLDFLNLQPGTYFVFFDGNPGAVSPSFSLSLSLAVPVPPPSNDTCATATMLTPGVTVQGTTLAANDDIDAGASCNSGGGPEVVYRFTAPTRSHARINVGNANFATAIYVETTCGDSSTLTGCFDTGFMGGTLDLPDLPAGDYFVVVEGQNGQSGPFSIQVILQAVPDNNSCQDVPQTLAFGTATNGTLVGATDDASGSCGGFGGPDVVYTFDVPVTSRVVATLTRTGGTFAPAMYLDSGACGSGTEVNSGCTTSFVAGQQVLDLSNIAAGTYYLWVDSTNGGTGTFTIRVDLFAPPPPNDQCGAETLMTSGTVLTNQTNVGARDDLTGQGACMQSGGLDVLYLFQVTGGTQRHRVVVSNASFNPVVYIKTSCTSTQDQIACTNPGMTGAVIDQMFAPGTYWIAVEGQGGVTGTFDIALDPPPPNDQCAAATAIGPGTYAGSIFGANDSGAGTCGGGGQSDVAYTFTLTQPQRVQAQVTTTSGAWDPVIYLRSGSCTGTQASCSNSQSGGTELLDARNLAAGTYFLFVDSAGGTPGDFNLTLTELPVPPPNDLCSAAQILTPGVPINGTNVAADDDVSGCGATPGGDVFYTFTIAQAQRITLDLTSNSQTLAMSLRSGCGGSVLNCAASAGTTQHVDLLNLAAGTYIVAIDGVSSSSDSFTLTLNTFHPVTNDTCSSPTILPDGTTLTGEVTTGASDDYAAACGGGGTPDVVYQFTLAQRRNVQITVSAATFTGRFWVSGAGACGNDAGNGCIAINGGTGTTSLRSLAAGTYSVVVDGPAGSFNILMQTSPPPPPGDTCADAPPVLPVGVTYNDTLVGAADDTSGSCGGTGGLDKVQTFTLASNQHVTITGTTTGSWPFAMYLRQGLQCSTASEIRCTTSGTGTAQIDIGNLGAGTYWVWMDATSGSTGAYSILLQEAAPITPPPNDTCAGAVTLSNASPSPPAAASTLVGANDDYMSTGGCTTGGNEVVYTFTLAASRSVTITASPSNASNNLAMYLRSGTCATGAEVRCQNTTINGTETMSIGNLAAGTYFLFVEGVGSVVDSFTLNYNDATPIVPPPNDSCSSPTTLVFSAGTSSGTGTLVNASDDSAGSCGGASQGDVVYLIPAAAFGGANKRIRATITSSTSSPGAFDPVLYMRSACGSGEIACAQTRNDEVEVLDLPNEPAADHYLWVDKLGGPSNTFNYNVQLLAPVTPPGNDTCAGAAALTLNAFATAGTTAPALGTAGSTVGAANNYGLSCDVVDGRDVAYSVSLASAQQLVVDLEPTSSFFNPAMSVRTGANCANSANDVACDLGGGWINCPNQAAGAYDFIVDGEQGASGDFRIKAFSGPAISSGFAYAVVDVPVSFTEIAGQPGSSLLVDYRDYTSLPLGSPMRTATVSFPFDVNMFGQVYAAGTTATVYEAGFLSFDSPPLLGTSTALYRNVCAPAAAQPNAYIAPMWDDMMSWGSPFGGRMWMAVSGAQPNRKVTIEWEKYDLWQEGHHEQIFGNGYYVECVTFSFQAILYENGDFEFQYQPININADCAGMGSGTLNTTLPNRVVGSHATIGLENANGSVAIQRACNADITETNTGSPQFGTCPVTSTLGAACTGTKGYRIIPPRCVP